jgi:altronate dehydratase large subunit
MSIHQPVEDSEFSFEGHQRASGEIGIRNQVLVIPSVICSRIVADQIAEAVPEAVSASHDHGCAQIGSDTEQTKRTLINIGTNPNVAGVVVVGLGCEGVQSGEVVEALETRGVPVEGVVIQEEGGTDPCFDRGVEVATDLVNTASVDTAAGSISDLTVGVVASDADATSIEEADPLIGSLVSELTDAGGRIVVAGTERLLTHQETARERMANDSARAQFDALSDRHENHPPRTTQAGRDAASRSFEEVARLWGDASIKAVLRYGERTTHDSGVAIVDAPSSFAEAATGLAAAGAEFILHVTAEGVPTGHPTVPVVKVTGNNRTYTALENDIDLNAATTSLVELSECVATICNGRETAAEHHGLTDFAITRVGPSM